MDWKTWVKEAQQVDWDARTAEQYGGMVSKLNADVLRAAQERLAFEDEPSTFIRILRELGN